MKLQYLLPLFTIFAYSAVKSQSDFDLSQRWFNESIYNPGATGNSLSTDVFVHSRVQWLEMEGAPITNAVSFDTYFDDLNSAFGFAVTTDKIGYLTSWSAKLSYAYSINFGEKGGRLAVGLSGYLLNRTSDISPDMVEIIDDPVLSYSRVNEYNPDFDFGLEYSGKVKIGAAVRHLLSSQSINSTLPAHSMNLWSYISARFPISNGVDIEPAVSYIYRGNISRIEGGAIMYFFKNKTNAKLQKTHDEKFWLGGMFRLNSQLVVLAGVNLPSKVKLGYSFDYGIGDLSTISRFGTHEVFLSWSFDLFKKRPDCPPGNTNKDKR
ncbi:MAG: PorP/SprF family type IX secretion system membrane protein [Prevotellaceae bacterium]|jgi:type IX secretion system PorP/SprF family membrane protein|nr:PorP/SprF family type IX secretion system membrane protein [Prevotellaceae bacterium]